MELFGDQPGLIYVVATLLPLASFVILLVVAGVRNFFRAQGTEFGRAAYHLLGGHSPGRLAAYVATAAIGLAFLCSLWGFVTFQEEAHEQEKEIHKIKHDLAHYSHELEHDPDNAKLKHEIKKLRENLEAKEGRWQGHLTWAAVSPQGLPDREMGTSLHVGFYIDHLSAVMFLMVTFIATLIHLFSIGYMGEEREEVVEDHEVHADHGHLHRRGRFGRFFLFLSLFCFSMLNLILADNLFQVFVSWELVGLCSYLLIGYYFERTSAANAANKAFITNRIGDAGFVIGVLIIWTYIGTLNFQDIFSRIRSPEQAVSVADHEKRIPLKYAAQMVRGEVLTSSEARAHVNMHVESHEDGKKPADQVLRVVPPDSPITLDTQAFLFPRDQLGEFFGLGPEAKMEEGVYYQPEKDQYGSMPYWLLIAAGLGIFLGCVGKSAQFPLHVWLPDAMEGPTPVSALIHAATMVAAGVYLVGRCFPLFTPEALLAIAYIGAITLTMAATIAVVMTDIKKVLAYSTVSQLGYMMLGLGVGGWVAGLFHLVTHAFFKALLFLCSGSVIYGCHHQQDMLKMGGLYPKMKITALTMLIGVFAIAGIPLFSGWYSKDAIIAQAYGFSVVHSEHFLLFLLPLLTAGLTAFYMFRLWFMTFAGKPRDEHVFAHAHESPWVMTVPLVALAFFSVVVAWGWPIWDPEKSFLEETIHHSMPKSVMADFGVVPEIDKSPDGSFLWEGGQPKPAQVSERRQALENHTLAGNLALGVVIIGIAFAFLIYKIGVLDPAEAKEQFPAVHRFLWNKWYFDEVYSALVVRPGLAVAGWFRAFDTKVIDGLVDGSARATVKTSWWSGRFDLGIIDGLVNLTARVCYAVGAWLRGFQTGYIRSYVLFLVLAAVGIWVLLVYFFGITPQAAGGP